jgi:hypothetical protein
MKTQDEFVLKMVQYLDGDMNATEKSEFEAWLARDPALKSQLEEFRKTESFAKANIVDQPTRSLTQKVMANLHVVSVPGSGSSIRQSLIIIAGLVTLVMIFAVLLSTGMFDSAVVTVNPQNIGLPKLQPLEQIPSINISLKLIVNVVLFLNLIIGLIVLDRSVLKPLHQRRMQAIN